MKIDKNLQRIVLVYFCISSQIGCTTTWQNKGTFYQTLQTQLTVETDPNGKVYLNNKLIGDTPLTTTVEYGKEILRKTRSVSYWKTQPGLALFVSLISLGIYLPFSVIPVDTETSLEPTGKYQANQVNIKIEAAGYKTLEDKILFNGEDKFLFKKQLADRIEY